jgi:hypothetical protein
MKGDCATAMNSYNAPDTINDIDWSYKFMNASVSKFYRDAIAPDIDRGPSPYHLGGRRQTSDDPGERLRPSQSASQS